MDAPKRDRIDFVVGSEMRLNAILSNHDVAPLLKSLVAAGAEFAIVADEKMRVLWAEGYSGLEVQSSEIRISELKIQSSKLQTLYHEGEPIGYFFVQMKDADDKLVVYLMEIALIALNIIIKNSAKRMLTTELHTTVVQQSYEELLETNRRLSVSEKKYRELAQTLEQKVEERTAELKKAHARLLQQEKLASIGQLAAGIAHEINNPIGFIYSNLNTFEKYIKNVTEMLKFYRKTLNPPSPPPPEADKGGITEISADKFQTLLNHSDELYKKLKIDFILSDTHDLIRQSQEGAERIKQIVANLKDFSHIDEVASRIIDINKELDNTINVLSHKIRETSAEVIKDYGKVSGFYGNPCLICQVFLNILMNALQSGGSGVRDENLVIKIKTEQQGDNIIISISDNGKGIPPDIQSRIFEPFFTTKEVGKGTGMGLTVAHDIVSAHGGSIEVKSEVGKGATFVITLPFKKLE